MVAAFVSAAVLLFVPGIIDSDFSSGAFLFRDPMTLFGIVLGSLAFETLARRSKNVATGVGVVQVLILLVCAWPFAWAAWESRGAERGALARTPATEALRAWVDRFPGRWYLAPQLDALVREGRLQEAGLWRDIWIYRGLPIVNGSFKGVSADVLYPSGSTPDRPHRRRAGHGAKRRHAGRAGNRRGAGDSRTSRWRRSSRRWRGSAPPARQFGSCATRRPGRARRS